jgi:integrase
MTAKRICEFKRVSPRWLLRKLYRRPGSTSWYLCLRDQRTGRVFWRSSGEANKRRAEQAALAWIRELERREETVSRGIRFDTAFTEYLRLKHIRPSTRADYERTFKAVFSPVFAEKLVGEIELKDVEDFLTTWHKRKATLSARTKHKYLTELRAFFRWAKRRSYCSSDPTEGLKIRKLPKKQGAALTLDQAVALVAACQSPTVRKVKYSNRAEAKQEFQPPPHLLVAVAIALHTGLRRGNVVRLRWSQIDLEKRTIAIRAEEMKAHNDFVVPIHPELASLLRNVLKAREKIAPRDFVLGAEFKEIRKSFKSALVRAGLPKEIRWHDLRHTFATWVGQKATFVVYRALLGHSPGSVSERYFHPPLEELTRVIDSMPRLLNGLERRHEPPALSQRA